MRVARLVFLPSFLACSLGLAPTGCAADADDEEEAARGTATSALQASSQGGVTDALLETDDTAAPDPEAAAQKIAEHPTNGLEPAGCATKTREGSAVTIALSGCSGPFGKITMDGALRLTFRRTGADVLHVDITGEDLVANGRPLRYLASADVRYEGSQRKITWHGESSGTTKRGRAFETSSDFAIDADVDARCVAVDGVSKGSVVGFDLDVTIEGLRACKDQCPAAGLARAIVRTPRGRERSLEVRFDGTEIARVKGFRGREMDVALACADAEAAE